MAIDYGTFYWSSGSGGGGGGGGGGSGAAASGSAAISDASSTVSVVYGSAIASALIPIFSIANSTDADPIFLQGIVTAYSTSGFTITLNAPADSANYVLSYATFGAT